MRFRDLTALQSVEQLLERELRGCRRPAVDPAREIKRTSSDEHCGGDGDANREIQCGEHSTRGEAQYCRSRTLPRQSASERDEVRINAHQGARLVDSDRRRRNLVRPRERVTTATDIEGAPNGADEITARFPDNSIRKLPLHLQTLLPLHPLVDGVEQLARPAVNRPARTDTRTAEQLGAQSALVRRKRYSCPLLSKRLTKMLGGKPNLFSQIENLILGEHFIRLAGAHLQLGGAREHALECPPV